MSKISTFLSIVLFLCFGVCCHADVYMANGVKIGEVDSDSAVIWTRLTKYASMNKKGKSFPPSPKRHVNPEFGPLEEMEGSVTGKDGEIRVGYALKNNKSEMKWTEWSKVSKKTNHSHQFRLMNLKSNSGYFLDVEGRESKTSEVFKLRAQFVTAPSAKEMRDIQFMVVTGQDYPRRDDKVNGHRIYNEMLKLKPDFFVHTGDIEYYDKPGPFATNIPLARFKWNRIYALSYLKKFHENTASYFIKDDHETLKNDCWPGQRYGDISWEDGLALFKEQVPMKEKTYRTIRWGKDLQVWLVEGRDYRSANPTPDGPEKTIWGKEQKKWFFDTVQKSDATFRILISPTPVVGPDRGGKNDNHANKGFTHEGNEIRQFISKQKNMFVVCGDRHWQYVSVDSKTGVKEFSCGPTTDKHAGGFSSKKKSSMHKYLKIKGGFLSVMVKREEGKPYAIFRHYSVKGKVYNEEKILAKD